MYYFKESLKHEENPAAHDGLGCCHHANSDYEDAIAEFQIAIDAKPSNIDFLKNRAQCYFDMG